MTIKTTLKHIRRFLDGGGSLDEQTLRQATGLDDDMFNKALELMTTHGGSRIQRVYEHLEGQVDHDLLEVVRWVYEQH